MDSEYLFKRAGDTTHACKIRISSNSTGLTHIFPLVLVAVSNYTYIIDYPASLEIVIPTFAIAVLCQLPFQIQQRKKGRLPKSITWNFKLCTGNLFRQKILLFPDYTFMYKQEYLQTNRNQSNHWTSTSVCFLIFPNSEISSWWIHLRRWSSSSFFTSILGYRIRFRVESNFVGIQLWIEKIILLFA